jgi:hypothetical protein
VLLSPELAGRPLAVYQHQDVISANHAAKAAGVKKHMTPAQARAVLTPVGGILAHVHHGGACCRVMRTQNLPTVHAEDTLPWLSEQLVTCYA